MAERCRRPGELVVTLATAHPAKFPEAVERATGQVPEAPAALAAVADRPRALHVRCPTTVTAVKDFVRSVRRD